MAGKRSEAEELPRFIERLMSRRQGGDCLGLDTGFPKLNKVTHGLNQGIYVIGGKPGCGKTTLTWQIAFQVAQNNEALVLFFSLDQGVEDLRIRLLSRLTGIESESFFNGQLHEDGQARETLKLAVEEHKVATERLCLLGPELDMHRGVPSNDSGLHRYDGELLEDLPKGTYGPPSLPAWFYMEIEKGREQVKTKDTLVVVDYVQKMYPLRKYGGDYERINIAMDELRKLSERIHGPVLVVSEINRENYLNPGIDSFKNSGRIEYAADVACVLKRKGTNETPREMELEVLKNRMGETGNIPFDFSPELAKFEEVK
jgi:replicative DNA helicase